MQFKKTVFLHTLIVCAFLTIVQGPLFADLPQDSFTTRSEEADTTALTHDTHEAQDATKEKQSFFSKHKKKIVLGGVMLATLALAGLGYHFWKPKNPTTDYSHYLSHPLPLSTKSTKLEQLKEQLETLKKASSDTMTPQKRLEVILLEFNILVKEDQHKLTKVKSDVHASFTAYEASQKTSSAYKRFLADNPLAKKLRKDAETVLSQSTDITKEQLRFLGVTGIRAAQTYITQDKNREAIIQNLAAKQTHELTKLEAEEDRLNKQKGIISEAVDMLAHTRKAITKSKEVTAQHHEMLRKLLDFLCTQSAEDLVDVVEKIILIQDAMGTQLKATAEQQYSATYTKLEDSITKQLQGMTDQARYTFLQDTFSQLKGGHIPPQVQEVIKEMPGVSTVFPEVQKGTIPHLLQPFVTFFSRVAAMVTERDCPRRALTTEECLDALLDCIDIAKEHFKKLQAKCDYHTWFDYLKEVMKAPTQQPGT